jgi:uncharacterized damage-inducible protein DinB
MIEVGRIADQLRRSLHGDAWHGSSVSDLLANVKASTASAKPLPGAHSIWEIVLHIIAWEQIVLDGLVNSERNAVRPIDWPAPPTTDESEWHEALAELNSIGDKLCDSILRLDDSRLDEAAVEGSPSVYMVLHGLVQHNLYHAGQIALLKKALARHGEM